MWKLIAVMFALFILSTTVKAEERVIVEQTLMGSGILCDTLDQVKEFVAHDGKKEVAGCDYLNQPVMVKITALEAYVAGEYKYLLVRYNIQGVEESQFGVYTRIQLTSL